jgi:hypothetical protein
MSASGRNRTYPCQRTCASEGKADAKDNRWGFRDATMVLLPEWPPGENTSVWNCCTRRSQLQRYWDFFLIRRKATSLANSYPKIRLFGTVTAARVGYRAMD